MSIGTVDSQRRIQLPDGQPGDVFEIQHEDDGRYILVPVQPAAAAKRMTKEECLKAMEEDPLEPMLSWEELRKITREP